MVTLRKKGSVSYKEPTQIDGLEDGSEGDPDEQEEAQPAQARKAALAKPRPRKRPAAAPAGDAEETTLLDIVKKHGASVAVAAKDWVERYREERGAATAELLTFLLQACGVDRVLSEEEVEDGEVDALKEELDGQAQEEGLEDHWRGAKAAARAFRSNYLELWDKVMRELRQADMLWDQYLLDRLSSLLVALNTSVVREFRFVATLTAAQLVTSWIHASLTLGEARDTAERQLAAEEKKKSKNAQRVDDFRRTRDRCHARIQELKSCTDSLFQGIFAHRFRDCSEEIRATVIHGIGGWVAAHPAAFLTDQYLKYVAWALSDKDPGVRLASASALLALYSDPDNRAALADFTQRFAQRFGELFYDVDERVAVKGVQLNTLLVRLREAQPSQFARVYELLADDSAAVRHAVAELVACALEEQGRQLLQAAAAPQSAGKRGAARRRSGEGVEGSGAELQLAGLLQVLHLLANPQGEGAEEEDWEEEREALPLEREVVAQVVDALFDRVPALSDWPLILSWAQQGRAQEHFGEAGLTDLLHLLRHALRKATGGVLVPGASAAAPGGHKGKERKEQQEHARQDATLALMKELPALLRKVQPDPVQSAALVGVVGEMKLEVYSLKRQEKAFSQLAGVVKATFLKHADAEVARECVAALASCAAAGPDSIKDAAAAALDECAADVASGLVSAVGALERAGQARVRSAAAAYERSGGEEEAQLLFDVRAPLARLLALLQLGGGGAAEDDEVHDALSALLETAAAGGPLPAAIVAPAMRAQLLLLLWRLRALDGEFADVAALHALARQRGDYAAQLESILGSSGSSELQDEAVSVMTDLLMVFSAAKLEGGPLEAAGLSPSDDMLAAWWARCQDIMRRPVEVEEEEGAAAIAARMATQRAAAAKAAQLAVFRAVPQHAWLAAQLLSQWVGPEAAASDGAVRRWAPVAEVVKEAARLLKKSDPEAMPAAYLAALQAAYQRMQEDPLAPQEGDDDSSPEQEFLALSDRIAKTYAGFNSSTSAVEHILVEGARHAVSQGPAHLAFLEGVAFFVRSLPARSAAAVRQRVEEEAAAAAAQRPRPDDPEWETFFLFLDLLDKRAAKGRVKSVLKKGEAGADPAAAAGGTAAKAPRKISFAARRDAVEESEEEGEEERDVIEEADDDRPTSLVRALPRSSQRDARGGSAGGSGTRRGGRLSGMTPGGGRSAGRRHAAAAAEEAEWEEEEQAPSLRGQQALAGAASEREQEDAGWEEAAGEPEEQGGDEEEEELEVMPTEEAMAIPPPGSGDRARGRARARQAKLRSIFEGEAGEAEQREQGQAQREEEERDDDEDLRMPFGGRQRAAPVVDPTPELAAGGEESEEEERPARRRRR